MHIVPKKNSLLAPSGAEILGGRGGIRPPHATHNSQRVGMERVNNKKSQILKVDSSQIQISVSKYPAMIEKALIFFWPIWFI